MDNTQLVRGSGGDVLLLSMRRLAKLVAYCVDYEFEDVITDITDADRVEVGDGAALEWSRRIYRYTRHVTRAHRSCGPFPGFHQRIRLERDYELFFPVFNYPFELFSLAAVPDWRKRCRRAACFVSEIWLHQLPTYLLDLLAQFDHIFVGVRHPVEEVGRIAGRPCTYLPLAADVLRFAPYPEAPTRSIDLCSIGRRSQVTHEALLRLAAANRRFFYHYDTVAASGIDLKQRTFRVQNAREHRLLLASLLQRSRFCFAHRGFVNTPEFTQGRDEISSRVYEAGAAGVVMLGEPPRGEDYQQQFDWAEPVVRVPFDCEDIGGVLAELSAQPERLARIRRDNVSNCALRHDWVHRLRTVFEALGLPVTEKMLSREQRLRTIAKEALAPASAQCVDSLT